MEINKKAIEITIAFFKFSAIRIDNILKNII